MANHGSANVREPHANRTSRTNTIINALKRRAQANLNDPSIDPKSRAILRYALEVNDPWLARLVRRADAGEPIGDTFDFEETPETNSNDSNDEKIEALTDIICRAGDEPETKSAALLVLMARLENSSHPKVLANTLKHLAFTRCGELNVYDVVDAQIAVAENELFANNT
ncbi:MAG TPA: hypothetical protein VFR78_11485 [Pyrinomonadaceae bacterium]|nr:hypothetical protein [Pyrinomonadaceae bacterium]